jgi:putative membrane protein
MNIKSIAYRFCMVPVVAVASTVAMAQMPPGGAPGAPGAPGVGQQQQQPGMQQPGANSGNAINSDNFAAKAFISKGMEGDQSEIQMGQLAEQKSQSNDVKQLAQKLVNDHTQMDEKWFKPLAKQMDVPEPKGPSKKDKKIAEKMETLSGADFDTQYLTMMLKDHKKDLKDFQDEAQSAQDPNLQKLAKQGANVISQHLQLIEQVAKNHNIDTGETAKPSM